MPSNYKSIALNESGVFVNNFSNRGVIDSISQELLLFWGESNLDLFAGVDYPKVITYGQTIIPYITNILTKYQSYCNFEPPITEQKDQILYVILRLNFFDLESVQIMLDTNTRKAEIKYGR